MHGTRLKQTSYRALSIAKDWLPMSAGAAELARADALEEQVPLHLLLTSTLSNNAEELALRRIGPRGLRGSGIHRQPVFGGREHTMGGFASTEYRARSLPSRVNTALRQTVRGRRYRSQPKQ